MEVGFRKLFDADDARNLHLGVDPFAGTAGRLLRDMQRLVLGNVFLLQVASLFVIRPIVELDGNLLFDARCSGRALKEKAAVMYELAEVVNIVESELVWSDEFRNVLEVAT